MLRIGDVEHNEPDEKVVAYFGAIARPDKQAVTLDRRSRLRGVPRGEARPAYKRAFDAQLAVLTGNPPTR